MPVGKNSKLNVKTCEFIEDKHKLKCNYIVCEYNYFNRFV